MFTLIAGCCVIESEDLTLRIADRLVGMCYDLNLPLIFKASYRKANRTSVRSFTGIGDEAGLEILAKVGRTFGVKVTTDVHSAHEAVVAARYVDVIQIPAFLSRQTDILTAAGDTGKTVNIKKGQFMSAAATYEAVAKIRRGRNENIWITERGNSFGYEDVVIDYRNIPMLKAAGVPVFVDITHTNGDKWAVSQTLGACAIAAGADGIFLETHPDPFTALSDPMKMIPLSALPDILKKLINVKTVTNER